MEPTKLHFTRVRAKEEPVFFDPATDIRRLFPAVAKVTFLILDDTFAKDEEMLKDFLYLHKCFCIMQIRLAEDKKPCAEQIIEFFDAIHKVKNKKNLFLWLNTMTTLLITLYGLFYRRDTKTDKAALKAMIGTGQLASLGNYISYSTWEQVRQEASKVSGVLYNEQETSSDDCKVICEETKELMEDVKELAGLFIGHSGGDGSWKSLAEACDREFNNTEGKDDKSLIALGLAYPDYEVGSLSLEVNEVQNESTRETQETEKDE